MKFIRVEMHVGEPAKTLGMCDLIIEKDTADGVDSSITGFVDMVAYGANVAAAKNKRQSAAAKNSEALEKFQLAAHKSGLDKGQNKDSENCIAWYVRQIKRILLGKHPGNEEALNGYGFTVIITNTGARKNVKIKLPRKPELMIKLGRDILTKHDELGVGSPLTAALVDMDALETLVIDAEALLHAWTLLREDVQALHNEALVIIGYAAGQTSDTEGTIYYDNCRIRERLLQKFQGTEEALSRFGFKVVISERSTSRKKGKVLYFTEADVPSPGQVQVNNSEIHVPDTSKATFTASGSIIRIYASETNNGTPGPSTPFYDVVPGTPLIKIISELKAFLGLDDDKPFLMAQNIGGVLAHYTLTIV